MSFDGAHVTFVAKSTDRYVPAIDFTARSPASRRSRYSMVRRRAGCWIPPTPWRGSAAQRNGSRGNSPVRISKWILLVIRAVIREIPSYRFVGDAS